MNLKVSLDFGVQKLWVGTLAQDAQQYYFKFSEDFLASNLEISPLKMIKNDGIMSGPTHVFDGLFGVFNDSLPDGWGKLLTDRSFIESGKAPSTVSALERLALVGKNGIGALVYEPESEFNAYKLEGDLDRYAMEAEKLLQEGQSTALDELAAFGGNSVGARPKMHVYYTDLGALLHATPHPNSLPYIIKFRAQQDLLDAAKIEFVYYQMAIDCGIEMSESRLFYGDITGSYYGTLRFDQGEGWRKHFHSMSGLLNDNFRLSTLDYGHLMDLANRLENDLGAAEKIFRLAVFNLYAHNTDDHSKNFGFLMDFHGNWHFAPAYDLTFSPSINNCHQLSYAGTYQNPTQTDLIRLAKHFNIKHPTQIVEEVKQALLSFEKYAKLVDIRNSERTLVLKTIQSTLKN